MIFLEIPFFRHYVFAVVQKSSSPTHPGGNPPLIWYECARRRQGTGCTQPFSRKRLKTPSQPGRHANLWSGLLVSPTDQTDRSDQSEKKDRNWRYLQTTEPQVQKNDCCFFFIWLLTNNLSVAKNYIIEIWLVKIQWHLLARATQMPFLPKAFRWVKSTSPCCGTLAGAVLLRGSPHPGLRRAPRFLIQVIFVWCFAPEKPPG